MVRKILFNFVNNLITTYTFDIIGIKLYFHCELSVPINDYVELARVGCIHVFLLINCGVESTKRAERVEMNSVTESFQLAITI